MLSRTLVRRFASLAEPIAKPGSGKYPVPNNPKYIKFMEKQRIFCRDDGLLVWQKLPKDVSIYRAVVAGVLIATVGSVYGLYRLAYPAKN